MARNSRHQSSRSNTRTNAPTYPLKSCGNFVSDEKKKPKAILYPRDPSLDPQLVWKGKDEEDRASLEVQALPIYIQEKIHPKAIIEDIRSQSRRRTSEEQLNLFGDFNGITFEDLVDFYSHKDGVNWSNRMILGDSLLVMNSLAEKEGLKGKIQMIYLDPPYGIKFGSNWQVSTRKKDVKDTKTEDVTRQPEQIKAFRDTWQLGVHSYLSYLRDRLVVARELLTETGSVFVQIGDENVHLVRCLLDEVFGSENFIANIAFKKKKMPLGETYIFTMCDYIIWYGKQSEKTKFRKLYLQREWGTDGDYNFVELPDGSVRSINDYKDQTDIPKDAKLFQSMDLRSSGRTESCVFEFEFEKKTFFPSAGRSWKTNLEGMLGLKRANRLFFPGDTLRYKLYFHDYPVQELSHMWMDTQGASDKGYVVQTSKKVIERCLLMTTDPGDLVLDPTCGSGTTACVAEQWGRRWITIDTSRVAMALARTRLMSSRFPYYILADSLQGIGKEAELAGIPARPLKTEHDIRKGFVYHRVPHVTLKAIANNPEIKDGMSREEIEAAIVRHADTELLYDQPFEDKKRVRVCGPFTVESLSPYHVLGAEEGDGRAKGDIESLGSQQFETMIIDNLRKAGIQNTIKKQRLVFDRLDLFAGIDIHAVGVYQEEGESKRAAICTGPEHGTVGPDLVKEAAKEAVKGIGFDLLIVCGFAFDPHASEEVRQYGSLPILLSRMNPDLAIGDSLLKKTGAGNLFMVFGEPDIDICVNKDDKVVVEIMGLDIYDPTTGEIRSHATDQIACWFIDTEYNDESFFVRHAYFCGADEPYERLKRALKAEVSESAWASLYSTRSRPFAPPVTGKIAVKVINHYGDEVLKVFTVQDFIEHSGKSQRQSLPSRSSSGKSQ